MHYSLRHTPATTKTLLHIENQPVNSRLLRKIMQKSGNVAILTASYDEQTINFVREQKPDYILVNIEAIGNNTNQIYHALVMLHELHTGALIAGGYDTESLRVLTGWMTKISFISFPLSCQTLIELLDNKRHSRAA